MQRDFLKLMDGLDAINQDLVSVPRILLMASLYDLGYDGATYRELKATLPLSDGALYSNLKALQKMGHIILKKVRLENRELDSFCITAEGKASWELVRSWLCDFLACGGKVP